MRLVPRALAASAACLAAFGSASAKTPGHRYCFHDTCHTVKTIGETHRLVGVTTVLKASFYDDAGRDRYNPSNLTSSGEYFHSGRVDNAASPIYPDGTKLLVWHPSSRKAMIIRVNNAGPYWGDRKLDLSRAAAEKFGFTGSGVASLHVRVLEAPTAAEATYKKGRTYPPVRGYLGLFASLDTAAEDLGGTRVASATPPEALAPVASTASVAVAASVKSPPVQVAAAAQVTLSAGPRVLTERLEPITIPAEMAKLERLALAEVKRIVLR